MNTPNCRCCDFRKSLQNSSCGCQERFRDSDFDRNSRRSFCQDRLLGAQDGCSDCSQGRFQQFADKCLCDNKFRIRLSGLRSSMAFRLRQMIGSRVKITLEGDMIIQGKITFVGNDFVEVVSLVKKIKNKQEFKRTVLLVQFDQIKMVERIEKL